MKVVDPETKILTRGQLMARCAQWHGEGKRIVTTNGTFDLLHQGHMHSIREAATHGDVLIIGVNSDASVKRYKSPTRPFQPEAHRAFQLASLPWVDAIHIFDEDDPIRFIHDVKPHVHCKGQQYASERPLIEEPALEEIGAMMVFLPMVEGQSTTELSRRIFEDQLSGLPSMLWQHIATHTAFAKSPSAKAFTDTIQMVGAALANGNKLFFCGNGGSAASAQHFAAEFVGRFKRERQAWPAIALTVDSSIITSIANDYGYENVFSRQLEGLATKGDILFCLSTSGKSLNCIKALEMAERKGMITVSIVGNKNGEMADRSHYPIILPTTETTVIQEMTDFLLHVLCGEVENALCKTR